MKAIQKIGHHLGLFLPLLILALSLQLSNDNVYPHEYFGGARILGAFLAAIFFVHAIFCWGNLIQRLTFKRQEIGPVTLGFGIGVLAVGMGVLGHLGLIGYRYRYLYILGLILPQFYFYLQKKDLPLTILGVRLKKFVQAQTPQGMSMLVLVGLLFLFVFIQCFFLNLIKDIYIYHLAAPRVWWSEGVVEVIKVYPLSYQAGLIEYLYLWAFPLLSEAPGKGLFSVLIFAQLLHFLLGLVACFWAMFKINDELLNEDILIKLFLAFVAVDCYWLLWTAHTAKTDWIAAFLALIAFYQFLQHIRSPHTTKAWFVGAFLGLSIAAKLSGLYFALSLGIYFVWMSRAKPWHILSFTLGTILFASPIWIRNFLEVGNPFFPAFSNLFSTSGLSLSWQQLGQRVEQARIESYLQLIWLWIKEIVFVDPLLLVLPFGIFFCKKLRAYKEVSILALTLFFSIMAFILQTGRGGLSFVFFRLLGPVLILGEWAGAVLIFVAIKKYWKRNLSWTMVVLAAIWFARPFMPWGNLLQLVQYRDLSQVFKENYDSGGCRTWMTHNISPKETIYSMDYGLYYFMFRHNFSIIEYDPNVDNDIFALPDGPSKLSKLKSLGVRILYTHFSPEGGHYSKYSREISEALKAHPQTVIHDGQLCLVYDLQKMSMP